MNVFHYKQFDIQQDHAAMKVGTDCDLLGAMTPCPVTTSQASSPNILDIGTGTGVLALMMAQRFPTAHITAVEIDDNAIIDAQANFAASPFSDRISLHHTSFQDFLTAASPAGYSCIICNPPYFDKSMECPDLGRSRARHSSSLPFDILAQGAYELLADGGFFTVCIPPEVLETFQKECLFAGFTTKEMNMIKSVPEKGPKRYVITFKKGKPEATIINTYCMRDADRRVSQWYKDLMQDFLL